MVQTYHWSQFSNLNELIEKKEKSGEKISVVLPTLNEEDTIFEVINTIKVELMEKVPLIDEIGIIDSGSKDKTKEIAKSLGAKVYNASKYLTEYGNYSGKGDNLWKALYLFKGDIIVYLDADIKNFHPKFIYGLIGPLLLNKEIKFVKAFYKRPLILDGKTIENEGGRVTEILVKPMINLFFPELMPIIQPLSGEYAGKRDLLEKLPFFPGYGVEIGILLEIFYKYGLEVIAQVDMDRRVHRNRKLLELRQMAFEILQVFVLYLKKRGILHLANCSPLLKDQNDHPFRDAMTSFYPRPPIYLIKEYRERFHKVISDVYNSKNI